MYPVRVTLVTPLVDMRMGKVTECKKHPQRLQTTLADACKPLHSDDIHQWCRARKLKVIQHSVPSPETEWQRLKVQETPCKRMQIRISHCALTISTNGAGQGNWSKCRRVLSACSDKLIPTRSWLVSSSPVLMRWPRGHWATWTCVVVVSQ